MLREFDSYFTEAIYILIGACGGLLLAGAVDFVLALRRTNQGSETLPSARDCERGESSSPSDMLLPLSDRPSKHELVTSVSLTSQQRRKGTVAAQLLVPACMLLGGTCFFVAACLYLPSAARLELAGLELPLLAKWIFRCGSVAYFTGSAVSLKQLILEVRQGPESRGSCGARAFFSAVGLGLYMIGSVLYVSGGILSQVNEDGFAETWIAGSVCFTVGALIFLMIMCFRLGEPEAQ